MEFVGRVPNEVFGTIHGPGYSGGATFGGTHDFGVPVSDSFHTFAHRMAARSHRLVSWTASSITAPRRRRRA